VTVATTDTQPWVQSWTFSIFDGYSCSGEYSVELAWLTVDRTPYVAPSPHPTYLVSTGVVTGAETWPQVVSATVGPQIVNFVPHHYEVH